MDITKSANLSVFGKVAKSEFLFETQWVNLNHGSFGTIPKAIRDKLRAYQDASEARPDAFIRYEYPILLDKSRAAVARIINAPENTVVFVSNATTGVNTVFRNIKWNDDGKDVILTFSTVYEACAKVADFVVEYHEGKVSHREIEILCPLEDVEILKTFRDTVESLKAENKRPRICIFDVVSSRPGVVFPWQEMVKACRELEVLSMVDGAQGIGMVPLDLSTHDPDFFVSNCHKWLHVPRGCAVFYVPVRNQHLIPSTLATSHGYVPKTINRNSPLPPNHKSEFVRNFEFVGTLDNSPYLCVADAIEWRHNVLGGEDKIIEYLWHLNKAGSKHIATKLGTQVLDNSRETMTNCAMANVALPILIEDSSAAPQEGDIVISSKDSNAAFQWILRTMISDYHTFLTLFVHQHRFWVRVSASVYLDLEDYTWAAEMLAKLMKRVAAKEYLS